MKHHPLPELDVMRRSFLGTAIMLVSTSAIPLKAESPAGNTTQPAEPEQLRGLPRPNELPLAQGPFEPPKRPSMKSISALSGLPMTS